MGLFTLMDYLKSKFKFKSRLPIPEFSGYNCMISVLVRLCEIGRRLYNFKKFKKEHQILNCSTYVLQDPFLLISVFSSY